MTAARAPSRSMAVDELISADIAGPVTFDKAHHLHRGSRGTSRAFEPDLVRKIERALLPFLVDDPPKGRLETALPAIAIEHVPLVMRTIGTIAREKCFDVSPAITQVMPISATLKIF
jgi:hypothetical protein